MARVSPGYARVVDRIPDRMADINKAKVLNCLSRYFFALALLEYTIVCANLYLNPAFNLGQVGPVDPILEGITQDEVYTLYTSIPDERAKRVTLWKP